MEQTLSNSMYEFMVLDTGRSDSIGLCGQKRCARPRKRIENKIILCEPMLCDNTFGPFC